MAKFKVIDGGAAQGRMKETAGNRISGGAARSGIERGTAQSRAEGAARRAGNPEPAAGSAHIDKILMDEARMEDWQEMPVKPKNKEIRPREYLTSAEIEKLLSAAKRAGRYGHRDYTLILVMYRHGLRVSEAAALTWDQVDLDAGYMHVTRAKNGTDSTHPISGVEMRALRRLRRETRIDDPRFVFLSERGAPLTTSAVRKIIARAGRLAQFPWPIHPHMLRHSCGYHLAMRGIDTRAIQQYLGHKNIQNTVIYTELSPNRFKDFWTD